MGDNGKYSMEELDILLEDLGKDFESPSAISNNRVDYDTIGNLVADDDLDFTVSSNGGLGNSGSSHLGADSPLGSKKGNLKFERRISRKMSAKVGNNNSNIQGKSSPAMKGLMIELSAGSKADEYDGDPLNALTSSAGLEDVEYLMASLDLAPDPVPSSLGSRPSGAAPPPSRPVSSLISHDNLTNIFPSYEDDHHDQYQHQQQHQHQHQNQHQQHHHEQQPMPNYDDSYFDPSSHPSSGSCGTCKNPIFGQVIQAGNNFYHPTCFICSTCKNGLGSGKFYNTERGPTCSSCFVHQAADRCVTCDKPIAGASISALEKKWHVNCFICSQCLKPFGTSMFYERDSNPFCQACFFGIFSDRCGGCDQPITGESINACGKNWHVEHFVCSHCKKAFGSTPYWEINGRPFCQLHYHSQQGLLCGCGCGKHVMGQATQALGKAWLPGHFVCGFCVNPLSEMKYKENGGKAYCEVCHAKLFK